MSKWLQAALLDETEKDPVPKVPKVPKPPINTQNLNETAGVDGGINSTNGVVGAVPKVPKPQDQNSFGTFGTSENTIKEGVEAAENTLKTANVESFGTFGTFGTSTYSDNPAIETKSDEFEEREAIIAANGTPEEWVSGYATLVSLPYPENWTQERWDLVLINAEKFLDEWGTQAHRLGWSTNDVLSHLLPFSCLAIR